MISKETKLVALEPATHIQKKRSLSRAVENKAGLNPESIIKNYL